jgi:hypothetical protein
MPDTINVGVGFLQLIANDVSVTPEPHIKAEGFTDTSFFGNHILCSVIYPPSIVDTSTFGLPILYAIIYHSSLINSSGSFGTHSLINPHISSNMPLFLSAPPPTSSSGFLELYLHATSASPSGMIGSLDLYLEATSGNILNTNMPLYILGPDLVNLSGSMILYIQGGGIGLTTGNIGGTLDLYLNNNVITSGLTLFIQGRSSTGDDFLFPGSVPHNSDMVMWLERQTTSVLSLLLQGPGEPASGILDLFIEGALRATSGIDLVLPNTYDILNNNLKLFIRGF